MARPKKIEETEGSVLNVREADVKQPEGQDTSVSENTEDQESEPVQIPKHIDLSLIHILTLPTNSLV